MKSRIPIKLTNDLEILITAYAHDESNSKQQIIEKILEEYFWNLDNEKIIYYINMYNNMSEKQRNRPKNKIF